MGKFLINMSVSLITLIYLFSLVGAGGTSSLLIRSEPGGTDVYIDNIYKGFTPLDITDVSPGNHIVRLTKQGYYGWENTTEISNTTMTISAYLEVMKGTLDINIEAGNGDVYIDDIYEGVVGKDVPLSVTLSYGPHIINITRDGCNYWNQSIQINEQNTNSTFSCKKSSVRNDAKIIFAFGGPSSSYVAGSTLKVDVIKSGSTFPVVLSIRDPFGNWTVLPYQVVRTDRVYFIYDLPTSGPAGTWAVKAELWDRVADGGNYKQSLFSNVVLIKWNRIVEGGNLKTRYDYKEKSFNVSLPIMNTSERTSPLPEPEVLATPTGNIVYTKVTTSKFGQSDLEINAGDEVIWLNEDQAGYQIVEIDNKIGDINLSHDWKARFVFNISGNYRFRLFNKESYADERFATPSIQNIKVLPPIVPAITPIITSTISPSVTPTLTITETATPTPTSSQKSTQIPTPRSLGFEAIIAGIGMLLAFEFRRR
jgi:plastocyanin